jgi:hypothetical protein
MIGEIVRIDPLKRANKKKGAKSFRRVYFKMSDGSWKKTDLIPGFKNYNRWKPFLKVGIKLIGLKEKDRVTIDADSLVREHMTEDEELEMLTKLGVFG